MRLRRVEHGHRPPARAFLRGFRLATRREPPDIVKLRFYRPEFFGAPSARIVQTVLRGPSEWTVGERELLAAFVSARNQCPF